MNTNTLVRLRPALAILVVGLIASPHAPSVRAQDEDASRRPGLEGGWCQYPLGRPRVDLPGEGEPLLTIIDEVEPNDTPGTAQPLPLGDGPGESRDIDVNGSISVDTDTDYYRFTLLEGEVIGAASLGESPLNTELALTETDGDDLIVNDDHRDLGTYYPNTSPFPGGLSQRDSALTWIAPATGEYLMRVTSHVSASNGPYTLVIRSRRPYLEEIEPPVQQILFLDFDGETINAQEIFGRGNSEAVLSPLAAFMDAWGLTGSDEDAVIDAILVEVEENLDDLRSVTGQCDFVVRNSRDDADPFGLSYVSRTIVGGTKSELGISTIGIADSIDPGNFGTEETAVVLLDELSAPTGGYSLNELPRAGGVSIIEVIGRTVGNIVVHEMGHYLGSWHTENGNDLDTLMDRGGAGAAVISGSGSDGIFGTADDVDIDFLTDDYESGEGLAVGLEHTDVRTAFGLSTSAQLTIYVDASNDGYEDGSAQHPFNTVAEGLDALPPSIPSFLFIMGGQYPENLTIDQPVTLQRNGGDVVRIGDE